mmetsp:Transcript_85577/g.223303  ORF Transcript_85577/g.223303 Transcript_85577/m.223303 type:complete len:447 (-) Transcript_85577:906-2246(-)
MLVRRLQALPLAHPLGGLQGSLRLQGRRRGDLLRGPLDLNPVGLLRSVRAARLAPELHGEVLAGLQGLPELLLQLRLAGGRLHAVDGQLLPRSVQRRRVPRELVASRRELRLQALQLPLGLVALAAQPLLPKRRLAQRLGGRLPLRRHGRALRGRAGGQLVPGGAQLLLELSGVRLGSGGALVRRPPHLFKVAHREDGPLLGARGAGLGVDDGLPGGLELLALAAGGDAQLGRALLRAAEGLVQLLGLLLQPPHLCLQAAGALLPALAPLLELRLLLHQAGPLLGGLGQGRLRRRQPLRHPLLCRRGSQRRLLLGGERPRASRPGGAVAAVRVELHHALVDPGVHLNAHGPGGELQAGQALLRVRGRRADAHQQDGAAVAAYGAVEDPRELAVAQRYVSLLGSQRAHYVAKRQEALVYHRGLAQLDSLGTALFHTLRPGEVHDVEA